jgi:hypothetical protein
MKSAIYICPITQNQIILDSCDLSCLICNKNRDETREQTTPYKCTETTLDRPKIMLKRLNRIMRITRVEQIHILTMYVTLFISLLFAVWVMNNV